MRQFPITPPQIHWALLADCDKFTKKQRGQGMKKIAGAICCLLVVATASAPQETRDFSGTFALTSLKGEHVAKTLPKIVLRIVQSRDSLEIVESLDDGKARPSKYFLYGKESKNMTSGGVPTVDTVDAKGKNLVIRSSYRLPNGVLVRETQKWDLSADSKTLKIRRQPQFEGMSVLDETINETYQRL